MTSTFVPHVYIFESPKEIEIEQGISEGDALSSTLKQMNIKSEYYPIKTKKEFEDSLLKINPPKIETSSDIQKITIPVLHISAHGCTSSFALTNGETINWKELMDYLCPINKRCLGFLFLCMSVCNGYSSIKSAFTLKKDLPYIFMVGPTQRTIWDESLLAFLVFYYNFGRLFNELQKEDDVINIMNNAINHEGLFRCAMAEETQKRFIDVVNILRKVLC